MQVPPSAYLTSTAASTDRVHCIPTSKYVMFLSPAVRKLSHSGQKVTATRPEGEAQSCQKSSDSVTVTSADKLLESAPNPRTRACLLASSAKELGAWLKALLLSSLGQTVRVAVGLCLGTPLCSPHTCCHCGSEVDALATHGLSCQRSQGCHHDTWH